MRCMLCDKPIQFWQWYDGHKKQTFQSEDCGEHKLIFTVDIRDGGKRLVSGDGVKVPMDHTGHTFKDQMDRYGTPGPMANRSAKKPKGKGRTELIKSRGCDKREDHVLWKTARGDEPLMGCSTPVIENELRFVHHHYGHRGQTEVMPIKVPHLHYEHHVPPTVRRPEPMPQRGAPIPLQEKRVSGSTPMPTDEQAAAIKPNIAQRHASWEAYKASMKGDKK